MNSQFLAALQEIMEYSISRIYNMCIKSFNSWDLWRGYQGALQQIPLLNSAVQRVQYQQTLEKIPNFFNMFCAFCAHYTQAIQTEETAIFFLHVFLSQISEKILMYNRAEPLTKLISETDRISMTQWAMDRAFERTSNHFSMNLDFYKNIHPDQFSERKLFDKKTTPAVNLQPTAVNLQPNAVNSQPTAIQLPIAEINVNQTKQNSELEIPLEGSCIQDEITPDDSISNLNLNLNEQHIDYLKKIHNKFSGEKNFNYDLSGDAPVSVVHLHN